MPSSKSDCVLKVEIAEIGVYLWNQNYFVKKIIIDTKCLKKQLRALIKRLSWRCCDVQQQHGAAGQDPGGSSTRLWPALMVRQWHHRCLSVRQGCQILPGQELAQAVHRLWNVNYSSKLIWAPCTETAGVACLQVGSWISGTFLSVSCVYTYWKMYFFLPPILASQWTFWCLHTIEYFKLHPSFFWCITTSLEVKKT